MTRNNHHVAIPTDLSEAPGKGVVRSVYNACRDWEKKRGLQDDPILNSFAKHRQPKKARP